jgi:hypothetical protein
VLLLDQHIDRERHLIELENFRFGTVAAAVFTAGGVQRRGGSKRPWTADDFFKPLRKSEPAADQAPEEMRSVLQSWAKSVKRPKP